MSYAGSRFCVTTDECVCLSLQWLSLMILCKRLSFRIVFFVRLFATASFRRGIHPVQTPLRHLRSCSDSDRRKILRLMRALALQCDLDWHYWAWSNGGCFGSAGTLLLWSDYVATGRCDCWNSSPLAILYPTVIRCVSPWMQLHVLAPRFTGLLCPAVRITTVRQPIVCCLARVARQFMLRVKPLSGCLYSTAFRLHCSVAWLVLSGDFRIVREGALFSLVLNFLIGFSRIISPYHAIMLLTCPHLLCIRLLSCLTFPFGLQLLSQPASIFPKAFHFRRWGSCMWCGS